MLWVILRSLHYLDSEGSSFSCQLLFILSPDTFNYVLPTRFESCQCHNIFQLKIQKRRTRNLPNSFKISRQRSTFCQGIRNKAISITRDPLWTCFMLYRMCLELKHTRENNHEEKSEKKKRLRVASESVLIFSQLSMIPVPQGVI